MKRWRKKKRQANTVGVSAAGTTEAELARSRWDVIFGMLFSNVVVYFIMLATATTLFITGHHQIESAADAAQSLRPLAGHAAGLLFTLGIIGVGFFAVPVMTIGAAYDVSQTFSWETACNASLRPPNDSMPQLSFLLFSRWAEFHRHQPYASACHCRNRARISTPPLMVLIMIMTSRRSIMGDKVNGLAANILGWMTTAVIPSASFFLFFSWLHR